MSAVRTAVEEKIGKRIARKVLRIWKFLSEYDAFGSDAGRCRELPNSRICLVRSTEQPKHTVRDAAQDHHPSTESPRRRLLHAIERTEDKRTFRKSDLGT